MKAIIKNLPAKTGVYQLKDKQGKIVYVGKAKNIRERVKSHLQVKALSVRAKKMAEAVHSVDFVETNNETEALVLENNLIKEYQPKYNVLLRDDKTFYFIKLTLQEDFPRILLVRRVLNDGAKYFGPKTSSRAIKQTIDMLQSIFKFRTCRLDIRENEAGEITISNLGATKIPCLEYHIQKCKAPCVGKVSKEEYRLWIDDVLKFLGGQSKSLIRRLEGEMQVAAQQGNFEKAAHKRDLMQAVEKFSEKQIVADASDLSADVLGAVERYGQAFIHLFQIRAGRIIASESFNLPLGENLQESFLAFVRDYKQFADQLILPHEFFESENLQSWSEYLQSKIALPKGSRKRELVELASKNADNYARQNVAQFLKRDDSKVLEDLQQALNLPNLPKRIEAYDISHLAGTETVASMIVFQKGVAAKADYRRFKITTLKSGQIDDFRAMNEVAKRRFQYLPPVLPADFKIKKATKKDFELIDKELLSSEGLAPKDFYVLKKDKELVGFVREHVYEKEEIHLITNLFIFPKFRKKGLAKFLINKILTTTKSRKVYKMACGGEKAIEHLANLGFREINKMPEVLIQKPVMPLKKQTCAMHTVYMMYEKQKKDKSFTARPDLILIDGGKGQLSSVLGVVPKGIAVCALAKREEEIFIPHKSQAIVLGENISLFLQRVRDEAHRFAISFNRNLRDKKAQKSALDSIAGVGAVSKKKLKQAFGDVTGIRQASDQEIEKLVGKKILGLLRDNL